jgi:hypothetical protein
VSRHAYKEHATALPTHVGATYVGPERREASEVKGLRWRTQVAVLWLILASSMSAAIVLYLVEPGSIDKVRSGTVEGMDLGSFGVQVQFAIFWIVPWAMALLAMVLKDALDRWVNGVVGLLAAFAYGSDVVGHTSDGGFGGEALVMTLATVIGLAIVWHAWKWPSPGPTQS